MKNNKVIIFSGPTASGKTSTSLNVAGFLKNKLKVDVAIVNFDSLLFYKELNIGTAKPSPQELDLFEHHLININSIDTPLNAADYIKLANPLISKLHEQKKTVILVGGSGFYLRALIKGMYNGFSTTASIKKKSDQLYQEEGINPFIDILKNSDPESFKNLHKNDHYRIIRAVEYFWENSKPISIIKNSSDQNDPYDFTKNIHPEWDIFHGYLDLPKPEHQKIIESRTKKMLEDGLVDEVKRLLKQGFDPNLRPLQSIGHKETISYLNGAFASTNEYIERIIISTRQLAKTQRTFFNKIKHKTIYHPIKDQDSIFGDVEKLLR